MERFNPINSTGVSIFKLRLLKDIGWIPRDIFENDMGVDLNVEQVVDGDPTAKYISVQLKTGFGNVYDSEKEGYIYYMSYTHYKYWLSSSIPVILVLCDPDQEVLYWTLVAKRNIKQTKKGYKIAIDKNHILGKDSLDELNEIIQMYQSQSILFSDVDDMDFEESFEYSKDLMVECFDSIGGVTDILDKTSNDINSFVEKLNTAVEGHGRPFYTHEAKALKRKYGRLMELKINVSSKKVQDKIPIIVESMIQAFRMTSRFIDSESPFYDEYEITYQKLLALMQQTINAIEIYSTKHAEEYKKSNDFAIIEHKFVRSLEDYQAELVDLCTLIENQFINK